MDIKPCLPTPLLVVQFLMDDGNYEPPWQDGTGFRFLYGHRQFLIDVDGWKYSFRFYLDMETQLSVLEPPHSLFKFLYGRWKRLVRLSTR